MPSYKPLTISRQASKNDEDRPEPDEGSANVEDLVHSGEALERPINLNVVAQFAGRNTKPRDQDSRQERETHNKIDLLEMFNAHGYTGDSIDERGEENQLDSGTKSKAQESRAESKDCEEQDSQGDDTELFVQGRGILTRDTDVKPSNAPREVETEEKIPSLSTAAVKHQPGVVPNAFDRMRPLRTSAQTATITIGDKTTVTTIGSEPSWPRRSSARKIKKGKIPSQIASSLRAFAAPDSQLRKQNEFSEEEEETEERASSGSESGDLARHSPGLLNAKDIVEDAVLENEEEEEEDEADDDDDDDGGEEASVTSEILGSEAEDGEEEEGSDEEYLDEESKRRREEARVTKLIQEAEEKAARPSQTDIQRAQKLLKGAHKDSTTKLVQTISPSLMSIRRQLEKLNSSIESLGQLFSEGEAFGEDSDTAEERLSLTVSKPDFRRMRIIGQFNLGFIIAIRPGSAPSNPSLADELFIIDQHASDEKFNFERLQATTTVQNQRLVQPQALDLTAIEEEIIADNEAALLQNGFVISMDNEGDVPVGKRCTLLSLPTSREVTFDTQDLEELFALLSDSPSMNTTNARSIPRPSKVRRLFAMRACRSSVMIGKTLTSKHMEKLVRNMGEIDKPWNCPHGRPTMRHLLGLSKWAGWREGIGVVGLEDVSGHEEVDWDEWLNPGGESEEDRFGEVSHEEADG